MLPTDSIFPKVSSCPSDTMTVEERVSKPSWTSAIFTGVDPDKIRTSHVSGGE